MRASTLATLTMLSFGSLLAFTGCDPEDDASHDDGAFVDEDENVSFRCIGVGCVQSPFLGTFDISNLSELVGVAPPSPNNMINVRWTALSKAGVPYAELRVTDLARCETRQSTTAPWVSCVGLVIDLKVHRGLTVTTGAVRIESESVDNTGALAVYKYDVKGNLNPLNNVKSEKFEYPVCPLGDDSARTLVMLPDVQTTYVVTDNDDGLGELTTSTNSRFTLACTGYAMAKGYTRSKVLPVTGGARSYGLSNYNAFTHAMRALYREHGTTNQYMALTEHGTSISIKDLANDPPLFDELTGTPPIIGYGTYLLESVYNASNARQNGRKGATCKRPYEDFPCVSPSGLEFPSGVHRRPEYSPPMTVIEGWSSLPDCDTNDLGDFGTIGVYMWYEGQCDAG